MPSPSAARLCLIGGRLQQVLACGPPEEAASGSQGNHMRKASTPPSTNPSFRRRVSPVTLLPCQPSGNRLALIPAGPASGGSRWATIGPIPALGGGTLERPIANNSRQKCLPNPKRGTTIRLPPRMNVLQCPLISFQARTWAPGPFHFPGGRVVLLKGPPIPLSF